MTGKIQWQTGDAVISPTGLECEVAKSERQTRCKVLILINCSADSSVITGSQNTLEAIGWRREA